jgi:hypothetical protein
MDATEMRQERDRVKHERLVATMKRNGTRPGRHPRARRPGKMDAEAVMHWFRIVVNSQPWGLPFRDAMSTIREFVLNNMPDGGI